VRVLNYAELYIHTSFGDRKSLVAYWMGYGQETTSFSPGRDKKSRKFWSQSTLLFNGPQEIFPRR